MEALENCNKKLQTLIELGNVLWDNNWNWTVIKQEIDFAETSNGSFEVGVATFVNIVLLPSRLERQNVGYSHITHGEKGFTYNLARKTSIIAALQETMCSFGGDISNKVHIALQNKVDTITKPAEVSPSPIVSNGKNENHQAKTNDSVKPKSPGKSRFTPKSYSDNSMQTNIAPNMNFNPIKVPVSGNIERINSVPARAGNTGAPFPVPKTSPTSVVTFNSKTGPLPVTTHGKPPLQQIPSNIITHDNEKPGPSNINPITKKTEEELRQERKRRQREKQDLFKKQLESRALKISTEKTDTVNEISTQEMVMAVEKAVVHDGTKMKRTNSYTDASVNKRNRS